MKIFYTPCVCIQTQHPKFLETYINKGGVNTTTITPSFMCYVFKQLIINKPVVTFQPVNNRWISLWLHSDRHCPEAGVISVCFLFFKIPLPRGGSCPSLVIPTGAKHRAQNPLERRPRTISTDRPEMESRP